MSIIIPIEKITIPFRNAYRNEGGTQHYDLMPNEHMNIVEKENNIKINRVIHRGADTTYIETVSLEFLSEKELIMFLLKWA